MVEPSSEQGQPEGTAPTASPEVVPAAAPEQAPAAAPYAPVAATSPAPTVYVCCGKRCRERRRARKELIAELETVAIVEQVDCQKICKGPVAGLEVAGKLEWFRKLDSEKSRQRLVKLITKGKLGKRLEKRRVDKRSGKRRGCCCGSTDE